MKSGENPPKSKLFPRLTAIGIERTKLSQTLFRLMDNCQIVLQRIAPYDKHYQGEIDTNEGGLHATPSTLRFPD